MVLLQVTELYSTHSQELTIPSSAKKMEYLAIRKELRPRNLFDSKQLYVSRLQNNFEAVENLSPCLWKLFIGYRLGRLLSGSPPPCRNPDGVDRTTGTEPGVVPRAIPLVLRIRQTGFHGLDAHLFKRRRLKIRTQRF